MDPCTSFDNLLRNAFYIPTVGIYIHETSIFPWGSNPSIFARDSALKDEKDLCFPHDCYYCYCCCFQKNVHRCYCRCLSIEKERDVPPTIPFVVIAITVMQPIDWVTYVLRDWPYLQLPII